MPRLAKKKPPVSKGKTMKPKKRLKTAKKAKAKAEDAQLHQGFIKSLAALEKFWEKKTNALKKNMDALKAKNDKAALKQKSAKGKGGKAADKAQEIFAAFKEAKEAFNQAKLSSQKYSQMMKAIDQLERDWLQQAKEKTEKAAIAASEKQQKKANKKAKPAKANKVEKASKTTKPAKSAKPTKKSKATQEHAQDNIPEVTMHPLLNDFEDENAMSEAEIFEEFADFEELDELNTPDSFETEEDEIS